MNGDMNLPFEPQEPADLVDEFIVSGGVVVMAAFLPTQDGPEPVIVFRFAYADGSGFAPPIMLGFDESQVEQLPELVRQAMVRAVESTRAS